LTLGKEVHYYLMTAVTTDSGRRFTVEKVGEPQGRYAVHIDGDKKACDCKGHTHHGHCKHATGIAALIAAGQL
jgi:hypothetical protein